MSPMEAYRHITVIIDNINALLSSLISSDIQNINIAQLKHNKKEEERGEQKESDINTNGISLDENVLEEIEMKTYFSPEKNNVIFASAIDTWAFTIADFAEVFAARLGCKPQVIILYSY